jgi:hypothetical protein
LLSANGLRITSIGLFSSNVLALDNVVPLPKGCLGQSLNSFLQLQNLWSKGLASLDPILHL